MSVEADTLGPKQQKTLVCLLAEPTIAEAAAKAGVAERTLHRWLDEPAFAEAYRAALRAAYRHAMATLQRASASAARVLQAIAEDEAKPANARVTAARSVLEFSRQWIELEDLEQRLSALEARMT